MTRRVMTPSRSFEISSKLILRKKLLFGIQEEKCSGGAINAGYKTKAKGELVMALDADSTLEKHTLKNTMLRHFAMDDISALAANVSIMEHPSILGLLNNLNILPAFL